MFQWINQFPRTSLAWLSFIRIGIGLSFLSQGISKLGVNVGGQPGANWLVNPAGLKGILENAVKGPTIDPLYRAFLEGTVLPNVGVFAQMVTIGELLVGLGLIFGLLTRLSAWGAIFLNLNFMLMKGLPTGGGYTDRFFVLIALVMAFTAAGYVLGLDGVLRASLPSWLRPLMSKTPDDADRTAPERQRSAQPI
jgi:thiosulfate dehydrogenase [quinone] large subunit